MSTTSRAPDESPRPPLPVELRAAIGRAHMKLNRLIVARLPLCLPPHVSHPTAYTTGMKVLGQIFFGFEAAWRDTQRPHGGHRMDELLSEIYLPKLSRSSRLHQDLQLLSSRSSTASDALLARTWQKKIEQSIRAKPHLIFAYAWTMYLAIFNGGRYIRAQLHTAGHDFWNSDKDQIDCLSFWSFDGDRDGEDIREEFDRRFDAAAEQLTNAERDDVVRQAVDIFQTCEDMIAYLDSISTASAKPVPLPFAARHNPREAELLSRFVRFTAVVSSICILLLIWQGLT